METRNITLEAPHPSPPPQGVREFQAYHYGDYAITTHLVIASDRRERSNRKAGKTQRYCDFYVE